MLTWDVCNLLSVNDFTINISILLSVIDGVICVNHLPTSDTIEKPISLNTCAGATVDLFAQPQLTPIFHQP